MVGEAGNVLPSQPIRTHILVVLVVGREGDAEGKVGAREGGEEVVAREQIGLREGEVGDLGGRCMRSLGPSYKT